MAASCFYRFTVFIVAAALPLCYSQSNATSPQTSPHTMDTTSIINESEQEHKKSLVVAHSVIMTISTTILMSIAIYISKFRRMLAKYMPSARDLWFKAHRAIQLTVVLFVLIGFIISICLVESVNGTHFGGDHARIGLVIVIIIMCQPLIAFFRPYAPSMGESKSTKRFLWEIVHKGLGYLAWIMAFVNVDLGLRMKTPGLALKLYIAWIMLIATTFVCLWIYDYWLKQQDNKMDSIGIGLLDNDVEVLQRKLSESVELKHKKEEQQRNQREDGSIQILSCTGCI